MTPKLIELRNKLAERLARQINNPVIEAKELHAFDLMISRRLFLKGTGLATLAALVSSSLPPTAWAKKASHACNFKPNDVGLTPAEMAAVTQATGISYGTELFQDTIYAQSVVAPNQPYQHCLIEAPRSRMRVQSQLNDQSPLEQSFLDSDFHFGRSELIQLEQASNGSWELVHYFHPWIARTDGGRADGLTRHVIMDGGLSSPTKIFSITGSHTNEFIETSLGLQVAATYLIYVEQNNGLDDGYIVLGRSLSAVDSGQVSNATEYPLEWTHQLTSNLNLPPGTNRYRFADKYVHAGLDESGKYSPLLAAEHIVIYLTNVIKIVSLDDATTPGTPNLIVTSVPYPSSSDFDHNPTSSRLAHIQFNPVAPRANQPPLQLDDFALINSGPWPSSPSGPGMNISAYAYQASMATIRSGGYKTFNNTLKWLDVDYSNANPEPAGFGTDEVSYIDRPDYSTLQNVVGLASSRVIGLSDESIHLKIGNFPGTGTTSNFGLCLFTIARKIDTNNMVKYNPIGDFPVGIPNEAGIGKITSISGGISKFGGLRLFASDDIGNLFMLRQRRLPDSATPYAPPIYIQNDAKGNSTGISSSNYMSLPSTTAADSNLQGFQQWVFLYFHPFDLEFTPGYNMLLSGLLGFGTDDTNVAQAIWLGGGAQAVYAPKRFGHDAEHMVVREVSDDGTSSQYNVFNVFNNIVEKTWVSRKIASQVTPDAPGLQESGDFYQLTLYATNLYSSQVALNATTNPGMMVEIRADAPATAIDITNNKYYDIDRYTSFVALPDPSSNRLRIAVKAENFSQILYARLLQTNELSPDSSDSAMLSTVTSSATTTDWVTINIAADGQARMAATGSASSLTSSTCGSCSDLVYICANSLCQSNEQNTWQTKGSYSPSSGNLDSLSQYMNQSGQNLADASAIAASFSLTATPIDPLTSTTALTADANRSPLSTTFDYGKGEIVIDTTATALPARQLGNVFSSLSHALHDALHWLQNVEGKIYSDLPNGVKIVIDDTENIAVTVSADIMKQVNGINADLNEVVSTVEEYGSVVVSIVVTIVESSFIFRFIVLLIELISLFIHLQDIKDLSSSLKTLIRGLSNTSSTIPLAPVDVNYPWVDKISTYVGSSNNVDTDTSQANIDSVVDEVVDEVINAVVNNPFTNKILEEIISVITRAISAVDSSSPLKFNLDDSIVASQIQLAEDITGDVEKLFVNVTNDGVNFLINQVVDDVEDPKQSFTNFTSGLGQFMGQLETDTMKTVYTALGQLVATETKLINDLMNQDSLIELDIALLADLFHLFGVGNVSGSKVTVGADDVLCFPMALIIWNGIFMSNGKSISDISQLIPSQPGALTDPLLGASTNDYLTFANSTVAAVMMGANGVIWTFMQTVDTASRSIEPFKTLDVMGDIAMLIRWYMSSATTSIQLATGQTNINWTQGYLPVVTYCRLVTAVTSTAIKVRPTTSIPPYVVTALNAFLNLVAIVWSVVDAIQAEQKGQTLEGKDWAILAGTDVGRAGVFGKLLYALMDSQTAKDNLVYFGIYVIGTTAGGFGAAAVATGIKKLSATAPNPSACLQPSPLVISQLIAQLKTVNIKLPKRAQCKQQAILNQYLQKAGRAYAQGDQREGAKYLRKFFHRVQALKHLRRIPAADADLLLKVIRDSLACQIQINHWFIPR